jgi:hypothetical protein
MNTPLLCIYRTSDAGYKKDKPEYITREACFRNFVAEFGGKADILVIADNISLEHEAFLNSFKDIKIEKINAKSNAGSFRACFKRALQSSDQYTYVYFVENDYVHRPGSYEALMEGLAIKADYVTLYDHPDKYSVMYRGYKTKLWSGKICYWRTTPSTTMTFAAAIDTLKRDIDIFNYYTMTTYPYDHQIFMDLHDQKARNLISAMPGFSTHGETIWLSPYTDWNEVINNHTVN